MRPRIRFGTTCRGPGKIYVRLHAFDIEGYTIEARATMRGVRVPARVVWTQDGVPVLVLCVFDVAQVVGVVVRGRQGEVMARARCKLSHHMAQLKSRANTLVHHPDVDRIRNCDNTLSAGDLELGPHRVVAGTNTNASRLQMRISRPILGESQGDEMSTTVLRAFLPDGRELAQEKICALGACVAAHERVLGALAQYEGFSVEVPEGATELILWAQEPDGYEGIWRLGGLANERRASHDDVYAGLSTQDSDGSMGQLVVLPNLEHESNVSGVINELAQGATAPCLVFVSAEVVTPNTSSIASLVAQAMCDDVGIASGVCLFPDGTKARGALEVAGLNWHVLDYGLVPNKWAPREVTAACGEYLAVRRDVWQAVCGVSEGANGRSWSADLCLKVRQTGLSVVEVPEATARMQMTTRDLGVASWDERMRDVAADAWLKQRWPEVLAMPDAFVRQGSVNARDGQIAAYPSVSIALTQVICAGDEDIVRGEVEANSYDGMLAQAQLNLGFATEGDQPLASTWVCMGDRVERLTAGGALRRTVGFSVRIPAELGDLAVHAEFLGIEAGTGDLGVGGHELAELRRSWQNMTLPPDQDPRYDEWLRTRHRLRPLDLQVQRSLAATQEAWPTLWVVVAEANDHAPGLDRTVKSLAAQTYERYTLTSNEDEVPKGAYAMRLKAGDELEPDALFAFAYEIAREEIVDCVYADEDCLQDGRYEQPFFKPDWDSLRYEYEDYLGRAVVVREGEARPRIVRHVPRVLLHTQEPWQSAPRPETKDIRDVTSPAPLVSIVIPNKDMPQVLDRCVRSILDKTTWSPYEVVIVENNSELDETFALYEQLEQDERVRVVTCALDNGFNFSRLINCGVAEARGDYVLMLNNDTEVLAEGWLTQLMEMGMRQEVGCVGAKLLYPDDTIQHVGVLVGSHLGPWHANLDAPLSDPGYRGINVVPHCVRAVTGACLLTKRTVWEQVGGMDETLPVDYNDVDYCLKVVDAGFGVVVQPQVTLRHYESVSRGRVRSYAAAVGFARSEGILRARWGHLIFGEDPSFNPNFRHNTGRYVLDD